MAKRPTVTNQLRVLRVQRNLYQAELAKSARIARDRYMRIEREFAGTRATPAERDRLIAALNRAGRGMPPPVCTVTADMLMLAVDEHGAKPGRRPARAVGE